MKLSIIVPAYNEARRIGACLDALTSGFDRVARPGLEHEVIVVDNNSTDSTAGLARQFGVRVIFEPVNQIARARNAGAAVADGDWLVFVDADTLAGANTLSELLALIESGETAGGASVLQFDNPDLFGRLFVATSNVIIRALKFTCGCFLFCRADAFRAFGGFDEQLFAGEDADFGKRLNRWARNHGLRVAILQRHPPVTSFRKIELYGWPRALTLITRWLLQPQRTMRDKKRLDIFYDGRR